MVMPLLARVQTRLAAFICWTSLQFYEFDQRGI